MNLEEKTVENPPQFFRHVVKSQKILGKINFFIFSLF